MVLDNIGHLPADVKELETVWPQILKAILVESRSPADPAEIKASMAADRDFMALVEGWDHMPTASQANAWEMIQERLWEAAKSSRAFCVRCGECCRKGSPVIFEQDRPYLASGAINRGDLVTLRRGERAYSNRLRKMVILEREQVKIREASDGRTCVFLGPGGDTCLVYDERPHQCRVMECWDPARFDTVLSLPPLTRLDLLGEGNPLKPLLEEHERRSGVMETACALKCFGEGDAAAEDKVLEAVVFDWHIREFTVERFGVDQAELDFLFGRPLIQIVGTFGFTVEADDSGRPKLVGFTDEV